MNMTSPNRLALVIGAVALVAAAAGWFLLVSGQRSEASRLQDQLDAAQADYIAKRTELNNLRGIAGVAPPKLLKRAIPDDTPMADVISELNRIGGASGVTFASVTPGTAVAAEGMTITPLETQFRGTWPEVSSFVSKVRRLVTFRDGLLRADGRLYSVRKIDLIEGETKFPNLNATLTIDVFQYGATTGTAPAPAPAAATTSTTAPAVP